MPSPMAITNMTTVLFLFMFLPQCCFVVDWLTSLDQNDRAHSSWDHSAMVRGFTRVLGSKLTNHRFPVIFDPYDEEGSKACDLRKRLTTGGGRCCDCPRKD